jgi:hypothetical protein
MTCPVNSGVSVVFSRPPNLAGSEANLSSRTHPGAGLQLEMKVLETSYAGNLAVTIALHSRTERDEIRPRLVETAQRPGGPSLVLDSSLQASQNRIEGAIQLDK